jgi:hypothetical protein
MSQIAAILLIFLVAAEGLGGEKNPPADNPISYSFNGRYGQVEVGGPCVGTEFHESRPLPSRISFYYPVANSIDLSTDYWKRGESQPMMVALKIGARGGPLFLRGRSETHINVPQRWIGKEPWAYTISPHRVKFEREESNLSFSISYEFCLNEPAMVVTLRIRNDASDTIFANVCTYLRLSLRTCQTYGRKDSAWIHYNSALGAITADFDDGDLDRASLFVQNVGTGPWSFAYMTDTVLSRWFPPLHYVTDFVTVLPLPERKVVPAASFEYGMTLKPGDSLSIIQVVGSCRRNEVAEKMRRLSTSWQKEVEAYNDFVHLKSEQESQFSTGDEWLDRSSAWARGILATNAHYLDGHVVPMPCPAEYNFFFTHDLLLTNLGAVNFDLIRVKRDLLYVASLSKDRIIPHTYYWRDDGFRTEYCTPDNWNHLWFILVTGSYLRHSMDDSTSRIILPLVRKSMEEILKQKKQDNLMYGFRPDWWDIGHVEGPRAYLTILTVRALREYLFINSALGQFSSSLIQYEHLADSMQAALGGQLWNGKLKYLMDRNGGTADPHYYMGSLLAPVFGLLDEKKAGELVLTAGRELVDERIGVRAAMPPDFHTKESIAFYKFAGDEAGQPYYYINGGVWPHNNAWYALALRSVGKVDEAAEFVKRTMTLDGIANSPMGIPAMYEYRFSDPASAEFGKIDKPSFLWAGGFYLYTLYHLFGVEENEWNVSIAGPLPSATPSATYSFAFGESKLVNVHGKGNRLRTALVDDKELPSLVLPLEKDIGKSVDVEFGIPNQAYLERVNARLHFALFDAVKKSLLLKLSSFKGHNTVVSVVVLKPPKKVVLDGRTHGKYTVRNEKDGMKVLTISFAGSDKHQTLEIVF